MGTLEHCAQRAVKIGAGVKPGERVVIIYDHSTIKIAASIDTHVQQVGGNTANYPMEFYRRYDNGMNSLRFPRVIRNALKDADVSFFVKGETKNNDYETFTRPMLSAVRENTRLRHVHMPGITEDAFIRSMSGDDNQVRSYFTTWLSGLSWDWRE